jgi:hypothetical protein
MSEPITISFRSPDGQMFDVRFVWEKGKRLREYLRDPVLRKYSLIQRVRKQGVKNQSQKKVKLRDILSAGDELTFGRR